ncbi:MAG: hypothetical protein WBX15_10855 [Thermoanaerobaculia bacterium]
MIPFLGFLPHQIPFRAVSAAHPVDDRTIHGTCFCSGADELSRGAAPPVVMLVEAMAQIGGALVFRRPGEAGYLSAIDACEISVPPDPGDRIELQVVLEASFGTMFRFEGRALRDGTEIARARFYLAGTEERD